MSSRSSRLQQWGLTGSRKLKLVQNIVCFRVVAWIYAQKKERSDTLFELCLQKYQDFVNDYANNNGTIKLLDIDISDFNYRLVDDPEGMTYILFDIIYKIYTGFLFIIIF